MAHIRLRYSTDLTADDAELAVDISVGPDAQHMRRAGSFRMHPSELNGLDRLLHTGSAMEYPAHTYELVGLPPSTRADIVPIRR